MNVAVYGTGVAAVLAAKYFNCEIFAMTGAPLQDIKHDAIMRFKTPDVLNILGIPQKKITVKKAVLADYGIEDRADFGLQNQYSLKVTGTLTSRSIDFNNPVETRYAADCDLNTELNKILKSHLNGPTIAPENFLYMAKRSASKFINTTPLSIYDKNICKGDDPLGMIKKIFVAKFLIPVKSDVYQTIYCPDMKMKTYRASIEPYKGETLLRMEMVNVDNDWPLISLAKERDLLLEAFGLDSISKNKIKSISAHTQSFGKLNTSMIDESVRKLAIVRLTRYFGVYSFGRYGTMRSIGLDSMVNDLKVIDKLLKMDEYSEKLYGSNNF